MPTRRRLLATLPTAALAGCIGSTPDTGGTGRTTDPETTAETTTAPPLPDDLVRRDGETVVDVPATTGGEVSVRSESGLTRFGFSRPTDADFELAAVSGGEVVRDGDPTASETLTPADEPRAFVAPVVRDGGFEFRAYANAAFRELGDLHLFASPTRSVTGESAVSRPAEFEALTDAVGRTTVSGAAVEGAPDGAPLSVALLDAPLEAVRSGETGDLTGVVLRSGTIRQTPSAPAVAFGFEYADDAVTITHEGGDSVAGPNLSVRVAGDPAGATFPEEVSAGDAVTVALSEVESGATVRVVWTAPDGDFSAVLAESTVP